MNNIKPSTFIRTNDDHELALVLNYFIDKKIWFQSETPISKFPLYDNGHIIFIDENANNKLVLGLLFNEKILTRRHFYEDITEEFFNENS